MFRPLPAWVSPVLATGYALVSCVGSDPTPSAVPGVTVDAGSDASASSDAGRPTCVGQPFDDIQTIVIVPGSIDAGPQNVSAIRLVGNTAYMGIYARDMQRLYVGTFTPGNATTSPTVVVDQQLTPSSYPDTSPAVWDDASFLVFAHGNVGERRIWSARPNRTGVGPPFYDGAAVGTIVGAFNGDESEPWLAGAPTRALYWARANTAGAPYRIVRSTVSPVPGDDPQFAAPSLFPMTCPGAADQSCGVPVVTPDERTMLFASTPGTVFEPKVYETALASTDGVIAATGAIIAHEELGITYPSWISADGCEAIFGGAEHRYARRTAR